MKQTNKLKMIATMAVSITVALFTSSCSNDDFGAFDFYLDEKDNTNILLSFDNEPYLSISTSDYKKMTNTDFENLSFAINRIKKSGATFDTNSIYYNISDTLFLVAYSTLHNTQNFYSNYNNKLKRIKNNNREGSFVITGKDCVGQAIAYSLYLDVDNTNSILAQEFTNYYSQGVPYDNLEEAFDKCGANHTRNTTLYDTSTNTSITSDVLIIKPENGDYHAMNILSVQIINNEYYVYARDKNYSSVCFVVNGASLPRLFWNGGNKFTMDCYYHLTKKTN